MSDMAVTDEKAVDLEIAAPTSVSSKRRARKAKNTARRIASDNVEKAMQLYVEVVDDPSQPLSMRKQCADKIMEYAIGKPAQQQTQKESSSNPILIRDTESVII